jgi:lipopolysaccharide transport system ATP-binding protein
VGDEGFQHKCFEHLRKLANQGVGIIFVSHSSQAIRELCDRAILLDKGELLESGEPSRVIESYHRLLFAPEQDRPAVRDSILGDKNEKTEELGTEASIKSQAATYDPQLSSDPTTYPDQGATISNITILDSGDQAANLLVARRQYRYQFDVSFSRSFTKVRFGMLIKSLTGFEIGGSETSGLKIEASAGEALRLNFPFTCNLNPGNYYLNAGVLAHIDGEETFVARVIDALQFKVLPNEYHQTGQVDFGIDPEILKVSE